jgi:uncharacterized membrane protein
MAKKSLEKRLARIEEEEGDNVRGFAVRSLKATADSKRTLSERFADWITAVSGSIFFLNLNVLIFTGWILANVGLIPGVAPFDPYPFGFLTMCVSLEAIVLATLVLISQNRGAKIDEVREEIDLNINRISEAEITQIIKMLVKISEKQGINTKDDADLQRMLKPISSAAIQRKLEHLTDKHRDKMIPLPEIPGVPVPWDNGKK